MTDLHLSLDEIIKKRKIKPAAPGAKNTEKRGLVLKRLSRGGNQPATVKKHIADARLKLTRKQSQRLPNTQDARLRLESKRNKARPILGSLLSGRLGNPLLAPSDHYAAPPLVRTVDNEAKFFQRRHFDWDRPAEEDEMEIIPDRLPMNRIRPLPAAAAPDWGNISITVHATNPQTQGILKKPMASSAGPINVPHRHSGMNLSERFNRDRSAEAAQKIEALKSQLKATQTEKPPPRSESGHRLIVSNLANAVTQDDVKELFADIGELVSSKLIRNGVAEVVYHSHEDAQRAVEVYHCRQLDGQPMICHLVTNSEKKTSRPSVELNMSTLRNALHKNAAT